MKNFIFKNVGQIFRFAKLNRKAKALPYTNQKIFMQQSHIKNIILKTVTILLLVSPVYAQIHADAEQELYNKYVKALLYMYDGSFKEAVSQYQITISSNIENLSRDKDLFISLFKEGDAQEAIKNGLEILKKDPKDYKMLLSMAQVFISLGNEDEALKYSESAKNVDPDTKDAYYFLGFLYSKKLNYRKSLENFKKYISIDPQALEIVKIVAELHDFLGEKQEAITQYERIIKLMPYSSFIWWRLAQLYEDIDKNKSLDCYMKVLETETNLNNKLIASNKIGMMAFDMKDYNKAEYFFKHTVSLTSDDRVASQKKSIQKIYAYTMLVLIASENKNFDEAVLYQKKIIEINNKDLSKHLQLAYLYEEKGDKIFSINALKNAIKLFPKNQEVTFYLGLAYFEIDEFKLALKYFLKNIEYNPNDDKALYRIGIIYDILGNQDKALKYFKKLLDVKPKDPSASNYIAYLFAEKGENLDKARELINVALSFEPKNYAYLDTLAWIYYKENNYKSSLEKLNEAISLNDDPVVYEHLGEVLDKLGNKEKSFYMYDSSLWFAEKRDKKKYQHIISKKFPKIETSWIENSMKNRIKYFYKQLKKDKISGKLKVKAISISKYSLKGKFLYTFPEKLEIDIPKLRIMSMGTIFVDNKLYYKSLLDGEFYDIDDPKIKYFVDKNLIFFPDVDIDKLVLEKSENGDYYFKNGDYRIILNNKNFIKRIEIIDEENKNNFISMKKWDAKIKYKKILWPSNVIYKSGDEKILKLKFYK
jgi:tetratricopeptide (TPR) repeat protein